MNLDQAIPCPVCQTKIPFDPQQLLAGAQFVCPNCNAAIGLAQESKAMVEDTMEQFDGLRERVLKMKDEHNMS